MKYLLTILFLLKISYSKGQDLPLVKAFAQQNFKCHRVKYFSELKEKVDKKKSNDSEVYYLLQGDQVLGFIFFYGQEPNFFLANKDTFTFFLYEGIDGSVSIHDSVLSHPYSIYAVEIKKKVIYNTYLPWRYPNFPIGSSDIWEFDKNIVKEFTAYPTEKIKPIKLWDTLIYKSKIDILKDVKFERMKLVGTKKNDDNLRPNILVFLRDLIKDL